MAHGSQMLEGAGSTLRCGLGAHAALPTPGSQTSYLQGRETFLLLQATYFVLCHDCHTTLTTDFTGISSERSLKKVSDMQQHLGEKENLISRVATLYYLNRPVNNKSL